jgi:hypothetical protein
MIALLSKKREINEPLKVKIGNNITKLNQGLLHILYLLVYTKNIISDWFLFNGHVFGTDENGTRHIFEIMFTKSITSFLISLILLRRLILFLIYY